MYAAAKTTCKSNDHFFYICEDQGLKMTAQFQNGMDYVYKMEIKLVVSSVLMSR